ncbi:MAG: zinc ribbon domain-containing protein [Clostridia bacterium]|nr:zinc ribbon domain-containing protein [Clostridia bacterium]
MICKYCGKEIDENTLVCPICGQSFEDKTEDKVPETEQINVQETESTFTEESTTVNETVKPVPTPKKKKKLLPALIAIVAVVAAVAVAVVACFGSLSGIFIKAFGTPEDYFKFIENRERTQTTQAISSAYGAILEKSDTTSLATKNTIKINVGDTIVDAIEDSFEDASGTKMEFDWLAKFSVDCNMSVKDGVQKSLATIKLDNKNIVDLDLIFDFVNKEAFLGIPSLSDKYVKTALNGIENTEFVFDDEFREILPTEEEFNELLNKYFAILIDNIDKVEKSTDKLTVGEIFEKKVTVLEAEIDLETAQNIALEVLQTLKEDEQIEKYFKDIFDYLVDKDLIEEEGNTYDDFLDSIDDAIESVENPEETDENQKIIWTNYVNAKHQVIGRRIKICNSENDIQEIYYAFLNKGKDVAFELEAEDVVVFGSGKIENGVFSGEFYTEIDGEKTLEGTFDEIATKDSVTSGSITVTLPDEMLENAGIEPEESPVPLTNPKLKFKFEFSKKTSKYEINFLNENEIYLGYSVASELVEDVEINKPADGNVVDEENIQQWASELDIQKIFDNLKAAGVPSELIDALMASMMPTV